MREWAVPDTGRPLRADDPDLLRWVHNSLTWAVSPDGLPHNPGDLVKKLMTRAAVALMSPTHRRLYGFRHSRLSRKATVTAVRVLFAAASKLPIEAAIPQVREYIDAHAFGARRRAVVPEPVAAEA